MFYYTDYACIDLVSTNYSYNNGTLIDCYIYIDANATGTYAMVISIETWEYCYTVGGWIIVPYYDMFGYQRARFYIYPVEGTLPQFTVSDLYLTIIYRTTMIE